jgi:hypothetical protein
MAKLLELVVKELAKQIPGASAKDKASTICDWIAESITYDRKRAQAIDEGRDDGIPYHHEVTLDRGAGICCDMAVLYVAMARRMGLKAYYADVMIDHKGNTVEHACAVVDLPIGRKLADPAYGMFGICHKKYSICEPEIKLYDGRIVQMSRPIMQTLRPVWRYVASLIVAAGGISGLAGLVSCDFNNAAVKRLEFEGGAKFVSQNGVLEFKYDNETAGVLKEYVFFCEAKGSELTDRRILEKYLDADTDRNSRISLKEARDALEMARNEYYKKHH